MESPPGREAALEKVLRRIRGTKEFPVISKYLIEINQKLADASAYTTASELANTIIKDYALTNKLLKLVNSAFYGFMAGKVTTVSRAVVLLGYENVRLAASSLVLFEHFQHKSDSTDLKEAVIGSFWCGLVARDIAVKITGVNPEEAFICAMFHQLGRLLIIFHLPEAYNAIKLKSVHENLDEEKAAKMVLGVHYSMLGRKVSKLWGFPDTIENCMTFLSAQAIQNRPQNLDPLHTLVVFVNHLGRRIAVSGGGGHVAMIRTLYDLYKKHITIDLEQLQAIIRASLDNVHKHADALQQGMNKSDFLLRLKRLCDSLDKPAPVGESQENEAPPPSFQFMDISATQSVFPTAAGNDPIAVLTEGLQEIINAMAVDPDVNNVALMSLEILYRALKFNQVVLFIHDTANRTMEARFRYGHQAQRISERISFKLHEKDQDVFDLAVRLFQDLIVDNSRADNIRPLIPEWYRKHFNAPAFIFFPIVYKQICLGAFYADRKEKGPPISKLEHRYAGMIRNQLVLSLRFSR